MAPELNHCAECVTLLGDYVDGALPADQSAALERHLSLCMPCITFLRTYKATGHLCRHKLAKDMPPELKKGLASFLATRVPGFVASASSEHTTPAQTPLPASVKKAT